MFRLNKQINFLYKRAEHLLNNNAKITKANLLRNFDSFVIMKSLTNCSFGFFVGVIEKAGPRLNL